LGKLKIWQAILPLPPHFCKQINLSTMQEANKLKEKVLDCSSEAFQNLAFEIFQYQYHANALYREYTDFLKIKPQQVQELSQIPFLPIECFRTHKVLCKGAEARVVFESSGTTGSLTSRHHVADPYFYQQVARKIFEAQYGPLINWHIFALLPSYLERQNSSLVFMADDFIRHAKPGSGFYLDNLSELTQRLQAFQGSGEKVLLLGVTFALVELALQFPMDLSHVTVMETGGMKGRHREMVREELHDLLQTRLGLTNVHAEYGMTELLSQFYSEGQGIYWQPATARCLFRNITDPFDFRLVKANGQAQVIDLANIDSCCFIGTQDIGRPLGEGIFTILGRVDNAALRGCNLMLY
jgi:hypothetical protein